jgi:adenine-specific DNA glycosylase
MAVTGIRKRGIVRHAFSHFTQTIHVFECQAIGDVSIAPAPPHSEHDQRWYAPGEIAALPLSKAHRIIAGLT